VLIERHQLSFSRLPGEPSAQLMFPLRASEANALPLRVQIA
jgi:hypothetical protein